MELEEFKNKNLLKMKNKNYWKKIKEKVRNDFNNEKIRNSNDN